MKLIARDENDYDVQDGQLTIELSRAEDGRWTFWSIRFKDQRFGGPQNLGSGHFVAWLDAEREKLS